jgi:RNA polymerase sigma-70 factor (ECF subfamily)
MENLTFEAIYTRESKELVRKVVNMMVINQMDRDDLISEVFIKAYKYLDVYDSDKSAIKTWLVNMTKNICIDYMRKIKNKQTLSIDASSDTFREVNVPDTTSASSLIENKEMRKRINKAFDLLEGNTRTVALMFLKDRHSHAEIAEVLDMPLGTVKVTIMRAREVMQQALRLEHSLL